MRGLMRGWMRTCGLLLCSITLFSCGTELTEATQIIVILDAEGAVRARTAELTLSVLSGDDPSVPESERSAYSETLSGGRGRDRVALGARDRTQGR